MQHHQLALLDQAIDQAATCYEARDSLLRRFDDKRYRLIQESLGFAALLLVRASIKRSRTDVGRAHRLLDAVLDRQNTARNSPDHGAFPLVWTPERQGSALLDPESREIIGTLLASILRDHAALLGTARADRLRDAIGLTLRGKSESPPTTTAGMMMAAWLDVEFGDQWRGERLATDVVFAGSVSQAAKRFGDARAIAQEFWALSLWRRCSHLHDGVDDMISSLLADIRGCVHSRLLDVFGALTALPTPTGPIYPWLGSWLTWYTLGVDPMMPKSLRDPAQAVLFCYPILSKLKLDPERVGELDPQREYALERCHDDVTYTGWREQGLQIEARKQDVDEPTHAPVAAARWLTPEGASARLGCRVTRQESAICRERSVHLEDPGTVVISVQELRSGETRMIDNGWCFSGLHLATEGLQMTDAVRTPDNLELRFKPTDGDALLRLSPVE